MELFPLALLRGDSCQNPGFFLALFVEKGGTGGQRGGKVRGIWKNEKIQRNPRGSPELRGLSPREVAEPRRKSPAGVESGEISRGFPRNSRKILRGGGISQEKVKKSRFSGPPGARPGGGPGGPPKIRTSRRIPQLHPRIKARTPDSAPAGTERRKTAAAWETDR